MVASEDFNQEISPNKLEATIDWTTYTKLKDLGFIENENNSFNVGASNYSKHFIQPWNIWLEYKLDPWDADIIKRILRTKSGESKILDYEKIIHICNEKIRQLRNENRD